MYIFNCDTHYFFMQRISHLIGLLSEAGKPILLMGAQGCGKTSIVKHRLNQHGGDIGEVSSLTVFCNKFTSSRTLWHRLSGCLEWKHANTFLPKGNKKLSCLIDDLNLSKVRNVLSSPLSPLDTLPQLETFRFTKSTSLNTSATSWRPLDLTRGTSFTTSTTS